MNNIFALSFAGPGKAELKVAIYTTIFSIYLMEQELI